MWTIGKRRGAAQQGQQAQHPPLFGMLWTADATGLRQDCKAAKANRQRPTTCASWWLTGRQTIAIAILGLVFSFVTSVLPSPYPSVIGIYPCWSLASSRGTSSSWSPPAMQIGLGGASHGSQRHVFFVFIFSILFCNFITHGIFPHTRRQVMHCFPPHGISFTRHHIMH